MIPIRVSGGLFFGLPKWQDKLRDTVTKQKDAKTLQGRELSTTNMVTYFFKTPAKAEIRIITQISLVPV